MGFFESISELKTKTTVPEWNDTVNDFIEDYKNILDICQHKQDLPNISLEDSTKILRNMKKQVHDFFSITTTHFINAGGAGLEHFNF